MSKRNAVAFEVTGGGDARAREPGAYSFMIVDGVRIGITHACPCGCGMISAMWFEGSAHLHAGGPEWSVKGEWPKASLSPSIGIRPLTDGKYHWHGYLTNGVFEEC